MFPRPSLLPEKILARVLWLARLEGRSVVLIAGCSAMISMASADGLGSVISWLAVGAGAITLHGVKLLAQRRQPRGMDWLVRGELVLLCVILVYVAIKLGRLVTGGVNAEVSSEMRSLLASIDQWGPEQQRLYVHTFKLTYGLVAALSLLFQGGLAWYYHRKRSVVAEALAATPPAKNSLLTSCPACRQTVSIQAPTCPHCGHPLN
ncbi:MAG: zinc ribbon domain-containing protein [Verrucomicrobiota bacterium]